MNKFFLPTPSKGLFTFRTCCPVGVWTMQFQGAHCCANGQRNGKTKTRVRFDMPSCGLTKTGRVEIEEVDTYPDSPPPSSPAEDAAADTGAHVAGAAAELANSPLSENEEVDVEMEEVDPAGAYADPLPPPSSPAEDAAVDAGAGAPAAVAGSTYVDPPQPSSLMQILEAYADPPTSPLEIMTAREGRRRGGERGREGGIEGERYSAAARAMHQQAPHLALHDLPRPQSRP